MRVLVTGTEGYIGSLLGPYLARARPRRGRRRQRVLPSALALQRDAGRPSDAAQATSVSSTSSDLEGFDAVVHMAELSNDPLGSARSRRHLRDQPPAAPCTSPRRRRQPAWSGSSTRRRAACTGRRTQDIVDEESPLHPQTAYAVCKQLVERDVGAHGRRRLLSDLPPQRDRLRRLAADALRHRPQQPLRARLDDEGDPHGERRHPLAPARARPRHLQGDRLHARGAARARAQPDPERRRLGRRTTRSERSRRSSAGVFPGCQVTVGGTSPDTRSYRVSFAKIHEVLPGFACDWDAGARRSAAARRVRAGRADRGGLPLAQLHAAEADRVPAPSGQIDESSGGRRSGGRWPSRPDGRCRSDAVVDVGVPTHGAARLPRRGDRLVAGQTFRRGS